MDFLIHDPLTRFIAQVAAIVLVSRLLGLAARKMGQPMVIAEISAGILLGPSLLGWLAPGVSSVLFTPDSLRVLHLVAQLGLVLFMFLVGLELDPSLLRGRAHSSVVISHTSIIVPFALGALLAIHLRPTLSDPSVPYTSFMLFLGVAMSITAFPVLARILTERRLLQTRVGAVTIACAAVDDVTAWCILAFVVAAARAAGAGAAIKTTVLAVAYILVMVFVVRPFLKRVAARIANREGLTQNAVAVTLLLLFASSWATELIGIHALFGAFLFGAVLPKEGGFARALAEKLEDVVLVVLLPLFFAYSGVRTQIGLLDSADAWWTCGLIITVACVGKFGGSAIAARLTGHSWREAGAVGILMNTRGLMELIVLNIGLDLGVISPLLFTMMVLMALFTTFMTTPLLHVIYPPDRLTRDLLQPVEAPPAPAPHAFTVLVCVAYDRSGPGLITVAGALAGKDAAARIYALQLIRATDRGSFYMARGEQPAASTLAPLLERAEALRVPVKPLTFVSADPGEDICRVAEVKAADLVLMGWHKPVLSQTLLGGTVYRVMREGETDVAVYVDRGLERVARVLVPFVGSPHDRAALALAQRLAASGAEVTVFHVVSPERGAGLGAREQVDSVFHEPEGGRVRFQVVEHESPAEAALAESANNYDLVIVGLGREWGLEQRPFGVQPERLLSECPTSLLVVRARAAAAERAADEPAAMGAK